MSKRLQLAYAGLLVLSLLTVLLVAAAGARP